MRLEGWAGADQTGRVSHSEDFRCEGKTLRALRGSVMHIQEEIDSPNSPMSTKKLNLWLKIFL